MPSDWIDNVRFTPVRLREGYDMGEVDEFLDRINDRLDFLEGRRSADPGPVFAAAFTRVRFREGYDMPEVDEFVERALNELARLGGVPRPAGHLVERAGNDLINGVRFTPRRLGMNYEMGAVDDYLESISDRSAEQLRRLQRPAFTRVRLTEGYSADEVEAFLDRLGLRRPTAATSVITETGPWWRRKG